MIANSPVTPEVQTFKPKTTAAVLKYFPPVSRHRFAGIKIPLDSPCRNRYYPLL